MGAGQWRECEVGVKSKDLVNGGKVKGGVHGWSG